MQGCWWRFAAVAAMAASPVMGQEGPPAPVPIPSDPGANEPAAGGAASTSAQPAPVTPTGQRQDFAEQLLTTAAGRYTSRTPRPEPCAGGSADEIVVCRRLEDPADLRVTSRTQDAIAAGVAVSDGIPRAPDFAGPSQNVVARGCFLPPCPRPPALMIDLRAIPEAPPGSDAARFANPEDQGLPATVPAP